MRKSSPPAVARAGFTLLELVTVLLIVAILGVISLQVYGSLLPRLDRARCTSNLRSLHVAADLYLQEHRTWPQIAIKNIPPDQYAAAWVAALRPYGLGPENWVCPTTQRRSGNPDLGKPENVRLDYLPNPFPPGPQTPYKWAKQPWFAERFNEHGNGNLVMFPDGHVDSLFELLPKKGGDNGSPPPH